MEIELKALKFAIEAHNNQVRKTEVDKPIIIHPINVGNIVKSYGFDSNVVAASYLHDVIEDTKYTKEDILEIFGDDITSLVMGNTEPDKTLSWEERKQHTIDNVKNLDLRHKAVVCADKISNLEDLRILFEKKQNYDFSAFNRGFEKTKWYYENVYQSLIYNEDENQPMFKRLKELIDYIFNDIKNDDYVKNVIFKSNEEEYSNLKKIHYKKQEILKLKSILSKEFPYVIEFTGTPRTGKTTLINNLNDFFKKGGFSVKVLEEFTTSEKYKKEIKPLLQNKYSYIVNTEIPKYVLEQLNDAIDSNPDIIIVDRSLFDRLIWVERLYLKGGISKEDYNEYLNLYIPLIKEKINIIISTYTDSLTALKRDYNANLSLEKRSFLNETNVNEYNNALLNMDLFAQIQNINFHLFDTTNTTERKNSIDIANLILDDMRSYQIERIKQQLKKVK